MMENSKLFENIYLPWNTHLVLIFIYYLCIIYDPNTITISKVFAVLEENKFIIDDLEKREVRGDK